MRVYPDLVLCNDQDTKQFDYCTFSGLFSFPCHILTFTQMHIGIYIQIETPKKKSLGKGWLTITSDGLGEVSGVIRALTI